MKRVETQAFSVLSRGEEIAGEDQKLTRDKKQNSDLHVHASAIYNHNEYNKS